MARAARKGGLAAALALALCAVPLCAFVCSPALPAEQDATRGCPPRAGACGGPAAAPAAEVGAAAEPLARGPCAALAVLAALAAAPYVRRTQRADRAGRSVRADEHYEHLVEGRRWFGGRKKKLKDVLLQEIKEEKVVSKRLKKKLKAGDPETEARIKALSEELQEVHAAERELMENLRKAEEEGRASEAKLETLKDELSESEMNSWKVLIDQQNAALQKILLAVEKLEARERELKADLEDYRGANAQLQKEMKVAERIAASAGARGQ